MNYIDCFTKFGVSKPTVSKQGATVDVALLSLDCELGLLEILQSDNGREFCSQANDSGQTAIGNDVSYIVISINVWCYRYLT